MSNTQGRNAIVQGRIVWTVGELFKGRGRTDFNTKAPLLDALGVQKMEFGFGLAVQKSILNQVAPLQPGQFWSDMHEEAYTLFPNKVIPDAFAMKYKDCDKPDDKGILYSQREGYENCIVLACTTSLTIMFYKFENGQNRQVNEGIKCGDYVNVQLGIVAHPAKGTGKAGLYLNPYSVQLVQEGKEIINKPSGDAVFGVAPVALSPAITPVAPVAPTLGVAAPVAPVAAAPAPASMAPPAPVAPNYAVIPAVHQPATPVAPPVQAAAIAAIQAPALSVLPSAPAPVAPPAMPTLPVPQ